jgi:hypothetical protein
MDAHVRDRDGETLAFEADRFSMRAPTARGDAPTKRSSSSGMAAVTPFPGEGDG